jgi:cardiolipin synthase
MSWLEGFHWTTLAAVVGYVFQFALIPILLLNKKKQPESTVAWLTTIIFIPLLGGVLFLIFGINRVARKAERKAMASRAIARHMPELSQYQLIPGESQTKQQRRLIRLATHIAETVPTEGNKVEVLADTNRTLGLIEQAVQEAKESLHLEYYIWQPDRTGTRLRDMLIQKAREGVEVRFLFDGIGSLNMVRQRGFLHSMRDAGIQVAAFLPGSGWRRAFTINLRSHRKIVVADGQVGFTGGMNIGDEYVGRDPQLGYWRDTHLRLYGPTVLQLQQVFVEDWYHATGQELTDPKYFPAPAQTGNVAAQILAGEPAGEVAVFHQMMFAAINEAEHRLSLATSYFVPTQPLAAALEAAALRGVRVRLLLAGRSAHMTTIWAAQSFYETLLHAGVEIYEYRKGLLHSKTLTIDGVWSLVGSPNFDSRSLLLNFEVGVVLYDSRTAEQLEVDFERDLEDAHRVDMQEWTQRPSWKIVRENVFRLFSPVL